MGVDRASGGSAVTRYVYSWGPRLPGAMSRKGQGCDLVVRGALNSALVRFDDGYLAVVSRNALRRPRAAAEAPDGPISFDSFPLSNPIFCGKATAPACIPPVISAQNQPSQKRAFEAETAPSEGVR